MADQGPVRTGSSPLAVRVRRALRWMARNCDLVPLVVAGLLVFGAIPPMPGIATSFGRHQADFQGWLLVATVMVGQRVYRTARWVRERRRTRRMRRRMA
jgi:hypothetical protein